MNTRLFQESGRNVYTGCELLVKGGLEGRVNFLTGYPGSPIAEVFDIVEESADALKEHGVLAQLANNEALSAARLNGTQMADLRAIAFMKSVGVHVASDALAISNMARARGGAVVVMGDDPHSDSTQVPADSRVIAQHLFMPTLEPSTFQEIKDWIEIALDLSAESGLFIAYLITSYQADGGGVVELRPHPPLEITPEKPTRIHPAEISKDDRIILPPDTARMEIDVVERRMPRLLERVRALGLNRIVHRQDRATIGFVTSGAAFMYLEHALYELGLQGQIPILKYGVTYPLDREILFEFAQTVDHLIVCEERRPLLETQVKTILADAERDGTLPRVPRVWGKQFPGMPGFPETLGLNPSIILERLIPLLRNFGAMPLDQERFGVYERFLRRIEEARRSGGSAESLPLLPIRTPGYCPGCPHRDSGVVLEQIVRDFADPEYMQRHHGIEPIELVFHGDIGCYIMFKYEPFEHLMHNLAGMGLGGGGTGAGIDPFITNKQVVFMGDSTFFHCGIVGISDSLRHGQDITYIILDNKTTAMTGHQVTPVLERDLMGNPARAQDIEKAIRGIAGGDDILIIRTDPSDHEGYRRLLEKTILMDGVKVIIADKECGITYHRRVRREKAKILREKGYLPVEKHINVTPEVCEFCLECTRSTGCPALTIVETDFGPKITTDRSTCVADEACAKIKACPAFEKVTVVRKAPAAHREFPLEVDEEPPPCDFDDVYYVYAAGVGGMGIGTVSAILVVAGHREGYDVKFCDKKGLAIRNGGVFAHVVYSKRPDAHLSQLIPMGQADVILGMDALEVARAVDPRGKVRIASPERTRAILNTDRNPTIPTLTGKDDFTVEEMEDLIRRFTDETGLFSAAFFTQSEKHLGNKIYGNLMMLGAAYQRGLLPLSLESLVWAIEQTTPGGQLESNLRAFRLGRVIGAHPERFGATPPETYKEALRDKARILLESHKRKGKRRALAYQELVQRFVEGMDRLEDAEHRHFAIRVYDLIQYENLNYARRYAELVRSVYQKDRPEFGFAATKAVIRYAHKVMAIKDEIYVAHLLTSEEKRRRDMARYDVHPSHGDELRYVHLNRPEFTLFGKNIQFDIETRDWQLNLMKRMKFLRRLLRGWHRKERAFRDWYLRLVETFQFDDEASYKRMVEALSCPDDVRGYREVRYPKMEAARKKVEALLRAQRGERAE